MADRRQRRMSLADRKAQSSGITVYKCEGLTDRQRDLVIHLGREGRRYREAGEIAEFVRINFASRNDGHWMVFVSDGEMGANGPKHKTWISFACRRWTIVLFSLNDGFLSDSRKADSSDPLLEHHPLRRDIAEIHAEQEAQRRSPGLDDLPSDPEDSMGCGAEAAHSRAFAPVSSRQYMADETEADRTGHYAEGYRLGMRQAGLPSVDLT